MKDLGVTQRKHVGVSCAIGALSFLFVAIGCDSGGGGDDGSGGARPASGGAPAVGGRSAGGSQNGGSGGSASSGAAPNVGGSVGGSSSGGSPGATGGQGGMHMNDPMCPEEAPMHEESCSVSWIPFCSYGETNCACHAGQWDCIGCPAEHVVRLDGEDCTGFEGEACRSCECSTGPEPKWDCSGDYWQTRACVREASILLEHDGESGCMIVRLSPDVADCIGDLRGNGYCVDRASLLAGVGCHVPTGGDGPVWRAASVTGSLAVAGDAETPIVTLDVTIEYDPESASGDPPPNDVFKIDSCTADCSNAGCQ